MEVEVVIVGGGPTGMMLAAELALANVRAVIVERRRSGEVEGVRARGLHARTIEVLDQRGVAERFLSRGQKAQVASFARNVLDLSDCPTRHNHGLALVQAEFERILGQWVLELEVPILRGREVTGLSEDGTAVVAELADGGSIRAQYLVGCDGGRSLVRKKAGIAFVGHDPTVSYLLADVEFAEEPAWGMRQGERGVHGIGKMPGGGNGANVVVSEREVRRGEPTLEDLRRALVDAYGTDFGLRGTRGISRFTDMARQAASYRKGRVLLAGDAAHVHSPVGGHGLNLGVQDAVNLGWKLGQVVHGASSQGLLDTYHDERHPVAARVLRNSMAQSVLDRGEPGVEVLREHLSGLLKMDEARRRYAAMVAGLDIHYDLGDGHPLIGRRMPDLDLTTSAGPCRVFSLMHEARWVLLNLGRPGALTIKPGPWAERVRMAEASYDRAWELPGLGPVPAPTGVLIRPDGHVAWVGMDGGDGGLGDALAKWFS